MPRKQFLLIAYVLVVLAGCNLAQSPEATSEIPTSTSNPVSLSCNQLIEQAVSTADTACDTLDTNQACYGHFQIDSELRAAEENQTKFADAGDIADLSNIQRLTLSPMVLAASPQTWGIALLKAQANLPDTIPGQNVILLLFGDAELRNVTTTLNAVTLRTGIGQPTCNEEPSPALLVQSPEGLQITMNFNGAEVTLGSTLYLTAVENGELVIATVEGTGIVSAFNTSRIVQPGAQVRLPLGTEDRLTVTGPPSQPEPFNRKAIQLAPLMLLDRPVQIPQAIGPATATPTSAPTQSGQPSGSSACVPRSDWTATYTVQRGDTLSSIARRAGASVDDLQQGNCIVNPNNINAGLILRLPVPISNPSPSQPTQVPPTQPTPTATQLVVICGNNRCEAGENPNNCQVDCGRANPSPTPTPTTPVSQCGNQVCDRGEDEKTCSADCASLPLDPICGNQVCESGESARTCPVDCEDQIG